MQSVFMLPSAAKSILGILRAASPRACESLKGCDSFLLPHQTSALRGYHKYNLIFTVTYCCPLGFVTWAARVTQIYLFTHVVLKHCMALQLKLCYRLRDVKMTLTWFS